MTVTVAMGQAVGGASEGERKRQIFRWRGVGRRRLDGDPVGGMEESARLGEERTRASPDGVAPPREPGCGHSGHRILKRELPV